jgi:hypothetical protein
MIPVRAPVRAGGALVAAVLAIAPFQCQKTREADLRHEDSPGDVLWALADKCRVEKKPECEAAALRYLIDTYPSSRHAEEARARLGAVP